jgi:hypothetical protein
MPGSSSPFAFLGASVHAVEGPWLPLENLRADAPGASKLQCALKVVKPCFHATWCRIQLDVGVHPDVLADIMGAMREHSDLYPTEYEGPPFVQVCGICLWY